MATNLEDIKNTIFEIRAGNEELKNEFVSKNLPLVWSIVHRFKNIYYDKEDIFQVGSVGLMKAINKYDPSYGTQFSTYAVPIIIGEIKRFFRDDGIIKVNRTMKELSIQINKCRNELQNKLGVEPSINEIATALDIPVSEVVLAMEASYYPASLSETIFEKDGSSVDLEDSLSIDETEKNINLLALKDEIEKLEPREKLLIELRFYQDLNQQEIAEKFNISQVQVSRMEKKIIEKMKKQFTL